MATRTQIYDTILLAIVVMAIPNSSLAVEGEKARHIDYSFYPPAPAEQTQAQAEEKSVGCVSCHTTSDAATMHSSPAIVLGCTDCHGGSPDVSIPAGQSVQPRTYRSL